MRTYRLRLLSPLFYRTRQDAGAAGSTITDPWIGDLALCYAINRSLGLKELKFGYDRHQPRYEELSGLPFTASIAIPANEVIRTQVYDIATSFISEGYTNYRAIKLTENAPMRNWLKRQGLAPGNEFVFSLATKDGWAPPDEFTLRLGNTQECLASCSRCPDPEKVTVNAYTLRTLFKVEGSEGIQYDLIEKPMAQYVLMHGVPMTTWLSHIKPYA
jgi:CRISPR type I-D-associated protein Csc1